MKSDKRIFTVFLLNFTFAIFELFGSVITGSIAIASDALHDFGDALSIGIAFILERLSRKKPDSRYTYGYLRYSLLGSLITNLILLVGSGFVIYGATERFLKKTAINYNGMIVFAVVGLLINLAAAFLLRENHSHNVKAVNLHLLEDTLGWAVVLLGAVLMRFTNLYLIDPIMSIALAIFIAAAALKNSKEVLEIFLEKVPDGIDTNELTHHLNEIEGVQSIHHLHLRSLDGFRHSATLHAVITGDAATVKKAIRQKLSDLGVCHAVIETEIVGEECSDTFCRISEQIPHSHHHH